MMFRTLSLSLLLAFSCSIANAQEVDDGGVSGTLRSFNVATLGPPEPVFTVPDENVYALTAVCFSTAGGTLSASEFGIIARGPGCANFPPGLAIPGGNEITCSGGAGGTNCTGTGVLTSPADEAVEEER
jgi:hypothetical protein